MSFVQIGKQWINVENITQLVAGGDRQVAVLIAGGGKITALGDDADSVLKALGVDAKAFYASAPKLTPPPEKVDWLTPAPDTVDAQYTRENPGQVITSHDAPKDEPAVEPEPVKVKGKAE